MLRKLTDDEFCSEKHREAYRSEQETLGLARLIESKHHFVKALTFRGRSAAAKKRDRHSDAPPRAEKFFTLTPKAQSCENWLRRPADPVQRPPVVVFPQSDLLLPLCRIWRSPALASVLDPQRGMEVAPSPNAGAAVFALPAALPSSSPAPAPAAGLFKVPVAGPWPLLCRPVEAEADPPLCRGHIRTAPELILPSLSVSEETAVPFGRPAAVIGRSVRTEPARRHEPRAAEFPLKEKLPEGETVKAGPLEVSAGAPGDSIPGAAVTPFRFTLLPQRLSGDNRARQDGQQLAWPTVGVWIPSPASDCSALLSHADLVSVPLAGSVAPAIPLRDDPVQHQFPAITSMPRVLALAGQPQLSRPEPVPVPLSASAAPGKVKAEPLPELASAALLPPAPDLSIGDTGLTAPYAPASAQLTVSAGDNASLPPTDGPHPLSPAPSGVELPGEAGSVVTSGLPHAADQAPMLPSGANPEGPEAPGPRAEPILDGGAGWSPSVPATLGGNIVTGSGDSSYVDEIASRCKPGFLPAGVENTVPRDYTSNHKACLELLAPSHTPLLPTARLRTVQERGPRSVEQTAATPLWRKAWGPAIAGWRSVPATMKWASLAIVLAVALFSRSADTDTVAAAEESKQGVSTVLAGYWGSLRQDIMDRAAVSLTDDFRSGLGDWEGAENWAESWAYDAAGFVQPGQLALYSSSIPLSDYQMEFGGHIERGALSWVCRAADLNNYYAMKLVIVEPGPLPKLAIDRYPVIAGKREPRKRTLLPVSVSSQTMYRIRVGVRGQNFTAYVQDRVVDFWTEDRLRTGGVGFFSDRAERARVHWVSVSHQYDFLGRLCAILAPYRIDNERRSLGQ